MNYENGFDEDLGIAREMWGLSEHKPVKQKRVKISKKIPARELRRVLRDLFKTLALNNELVNGLEQQAVKVQADLLATNMQNQRLAADLDQSMKIQKAEYQLAVDEISELLAARGIGRHQAGQSVDHLIKNIHAVLCNVIELARADAEAAAEVARRAHFQWLNVFTAELHDNGILPVANYIYDHDVAPAIISRVNQIAADFSNARDEQLAMAARAHHEEILAVEKRLELALEDMTAKYMAEVALNQMAERHVKQAGTSAVNAWKAVERAQRPWWRKALAWAKGTGPTFEFHRADRVPAHDVTSAFSHDRVPLGVDPQTGAVLYTSARGAGK